MLAVFRGESFERELMFVVRSMLVGGACSAALLGGTDVAMAQDAGSAMAGVHAVDGSLAIADGYGVAQGDGSGVGSGSGDGSGVGSGSGSGSGSGVGSGVG